MESKNNYAIDFFRVVFSFVLVVFHGGSKFMEPETGWFIGGNLATEFFFILSGFLLNRSLRREESLSEKSMDLAGDTFSFMKRKILPIYPFFLLAFSSMFILEAVVEHKSLYLFLRDLLFAIPELLLIRMAGWSPKFKGYIGPGWFLSALFLALLIIYPIARNRRKIFCSIIAPITAVVLIGFIMQTDGTLQVIGDTYSFFASAGLKRAIAEVCCGCFVYEIYEALKIRGGGARHICHMVRNRIAVIRMHLLLRLERISQSFFGCGGNNHVGFDNDSFYGEYCTC